MCMRLTAIAVSIHEQLDGVVKRQLRLRRALDGLDGVEVANDGRVVRVARVVELEVDGRLARVRDQRKTEITLRKKSSITSTVVTSSPLDLRPERTSTRSDM